MIGALAIFVMSCTVQWTEYDGSPRRLHLPWLAFETAAAAQQAVRQQNAAHNPKAAHCDYRRVDLQPPTAKAPGAHEIAIVLQDDTAAALVNALILAFGIVPPAPPCPPDPHAEVRGVKPANPPCPPP